MDICLYQDQQPFSTIEPSNVIPNIPEPPEDFLQMHQSAFREENH